MVSKVNFGVAGIWIFLSVVGAAILVALGYWIFYRISINKSLHSDKPRKRVPPQNIIIAILGSLLFLSVGFSIQRIVYDYKQNTTNTPHEYFSYSYEDNRGSAFDALFDDYDTAQQSGYLLSVWQENGFEICELTGGRSTNSLMPDNIIRVRFIDELPTLNSGEQLDFSFKFLFKDAKKADASYTGYGFTGKYRQIYITYNCYGLYDIKIESDLHIRSNKIDEVEPFAQILFEMGITQS